jgi:hypothetical protein
MIRRRAAALVATLVTAALPAAARAGSTQESIFQDDNHLVYASTSTVQSTLDSLAALGVDRVRITVKWSAVAPDPMGSVYPSNFNASDPAAYPAANWAPYDRVLELALAHGIGVDFNVTAPGPLWAMKHGAPTAKEADHYAPNVNEWSQFVSAVGTRYDGSYVPPAPPSTTTTPPPNGLLGLPITLPTLSPDAAPSAAAAAAQGSAPTNPLALPRVHYWEIWNEPNVDGWLAPQWRKIGRANVLNSPRLYRQYLDAAFGALFQTSHTTAHDTILIGDTAPEGYPGPTVYPEAEPMPFMQALYCVNGLYHPLGGRAAANLGCPTKFNAAAFRNAHPALFTATGYAHHPYYFYFPPSFVSTNTGFVPMANLSRLEGGLDRVYRLYRAGGHVPLYLTEYGYQTNPPDPYQTVSPAQQAAYLNQADYMAYRDPRVRSVSQFLLYDDNPDGTQAGGSVAYWATFQTGLVYANGTRKPAYQAYLLPIWIPYSHYRRGSSTPLWGQLRPAPRGSKQKAKIEWSASTRGPFKTLTTVKVSSKFEYFTIGVKPPGSGVLRIVWTDPGHGTIASRLASVTAI